MTFYACSECPWKGPSPTPWLPIEFKHVCPECGGTLEKLVIEQVEEEELKKEEDNGT